MQPKIIALLITAAPMITGCQDLLNQRSLIPQMIEANIAVVERKKPAKQRIVKWLSRAELSQAKKVAWPPDLMIVGTVTRLPPDSEHPYYMVGDITCWPSEGVSDRPPTLGAIVIVSCVNMALLKNGSLDACEWQLLSSFSPSSIEYKAANLILSGKEKMVQLLPSVPTEILKNNAMRDAKANGWRLR